MNEQIIIYDEKTASLKTVLEHLTKCSNNFVPNLNETVDIGIYSKKIVENSVTFEAWINTELIGLIAAYFNDVKQGVGFITNVSVVKEYFGKGIAHQLLHNCIQYGIIHQFKIISLEVFYQNNKAIQLYKKYGFYKTGSKQDNTIMQKDL